MEQEDIPAAGADDGIPGQMSFTRVVPASVPSLRHSSTPATPSSAANNSLPFTLVSAAGDDVSRDALVIFVSRRA